MKSKRSRKSRVPALRKGLTVDELLSGTWMVNPDRYFNDGEMFDLANKILRDACQGLIDGADGDSTVTRKTVISTFCNLSRMLIHAKDHITIGMGEGKFTPTLLDKIANA